MNHRTIAYTLFAVAVLLVGSATAFAHNGVEHVMGTVTAVTDTSVTVETLKHTSVTILLDSSTTFTNNDAKASRKDLKVGDRVVVNAKENANKKLVADSVKIGSAANSPDEHAAHKK